MKKSGNEKTEGKVSKTMFKQSDTVDKKHADKKNEKKGKHYIAEKKAVKTNKEKKENIFKRIARYFKGVFKEVKRIRWTSGNDLIKYSVCTVVSVLFFGLYFYAIDWMVLLIRSLAK